MWGQTPPNVGKSSVNLCQKRLILAWAPLLLNARSMARVCKRKFTMWRFWPISCKQKFTKLRALPARPGPSMLRNRYALCWYGLIRSGADAAAELAQVLKGDRK